MTEMDALKNEMWSISILEYKYNENGNLSFYNSLFNTIPIYMYCKCYCILLQYICVCLALIKF